MERLLQLRREYEENKKYLTFPLSLQERQLLTQRHNEILAEARTIAESLNMAGEHWFHAEEL